MRTWINALVVLATACSCPGTGPVTDTDTGTTLDGGDGGIGFPDGGAPADGDARKDSGPCTEPLIHGTGKPLAKLNSCGRLSYGLYANQGQTNEVHRLPDFSFAGYKRGGVSLPTAAVAVTLTPLAGDNRASIQAAIDQVSAQPPGADGLRGAVLLKAGTYQVSDTLYIKASGVVLRGEGQGPNGTVLVATRKEQHDLIAVEGAGSGFGEVADTRTDITTSYLPVGAVSFDVASASAYSVGDVVAVLRTPNQAWINALDMGQFGWTTDGYTVAHERRIVAVSGNTVSVEIPLADTLETGYGGGALFLADLSERIQQVGIEDLRLVSEYADLTDENHGWRAIHFRRVTNSWVRGVSAVHFGYCTVCLSSQSSFNTIEECAFLEPVSLVQGSRRYSFAVNSGTGNLFQRCYSEQSRHDFVLGARTTGPNVWLDVYSHQSSNDDGPHHRWSTGMLIDNAVSLYLHVENREDSGTGHGWAGAQTLFYNSIAEGIRCDAPPGAMNWTIGCMGEQQEGGWAPGEPFGWWESLGKPVEPRSLYLQQLQDRLGAQAVRNVTTAAQRSGRIWGQLRAWAGQGALKDYGPPSGGDPTCANGIASGLSCCKASCGKCGGAGCGSLPGGGDNCCTGQIKKSGRTCQTVGAPCILDPAFKPIGVAP
jgi:hypothetical protein